MNMTHNKSETSLLEPAYSPKPAKPSRRVIRLEDPSPSPSVSPKPDTPSPSAKLKRETRS